MSGEISQQKLLGRLRTLAWMSEAQLAKLSTATITRRVRRHETIFFEGEDANRVYLLLSGVAKLTFLSASERILVSLVGPGEIFGVSSLLTVAKRPFRCDAFSDCLVGVTSPHDFVDTALGVRLEDLSRVLDVTVGRWWAMLQRYTNFLGLALREVLQGTWAPPLQVGHFATISIFESLWGSCCQMASVTKGMKGWRSFNEMIKIS